ncbi:hypothetical protein [Salinisphaera sp. S4-8]|uniref:hypothetical protein n=1 Tax=Salinisphaera sp. S4-8 TaxID=633357 RepID=UPI00334178A9
MIQETETKALFLELAIFVSIADVRGGCDDEYTEAEAYGFSVSGVDTEKEKALLKLFSKKNIEQQQLELYRQEMGYKQASVWVPASKGDNTIAMLYGSVMTALIGVAETTNERLLSDESLRVQFLCDAIDKVLEELDLELDSIPPQEKKAMVFELAGMGFADREISSSERHILEHICTRFDVDDGIIDEAQEIIVRMQDLRDEGLALIQE